MAFNLVFKGLSKAVLFRISGSNEHTGTFTFVLSFPKVKGKAVPLQAWSGPEGSRKLRIPDFMTTAQDGGKAVSLTQPAAFTPNKYTWYSFL